MSAIFKKHILAGNNYCFTSELVIYATNGLAERPAWVTSKITRHSSVLSCRDLEIDFGSERSRDTLTNIYPELPPPTKSVGS